MKEIWKNIKGYEDLYHVSNLGRVKRLETNIPEPNICACCKGIYKQTHNFVFKYKELPIKK